MPTQRIASGARNRVATIQAKPHSVSFDTGATAVLVIDMQNDFGAEGGMFHRAGIDISMIRRAVGPTARVLVAARQHGIPVIYLKMGFKPDLSDLGPTHSANFARHQFMGVGSVVTTPDGRQSRVLVRDTWSTDIVAELTPEPADISLYKHRFSGFFETELDGVLQRLGVDTWSSPVAQQASALSPRFATRCSGITCAYSSKTVRANPSDMGSHGVTTRRLCCRFRCCSAGRHRRETSLLHSAWSHR